MITPLRTYSFEPLSVGKLLDRAATLVIRQRRTVFIVAAIWAVLVIVAELLSGGLNASAIFFSQSSTAHGKHGPVAAPRFTAASAILGLLGLLATPVFYIVLLRILYCEYSAEPVKLPQLTQQALRAAPGVVGKYIVCYFGAFLPIFMISFLVFLIVTVVVGIIVAALTVALTHGSMVHRATVTAVGFGIIVLIIVPAAAVIFSLLMSSLALFHGRITIERASIGLMLKQLYGHIFSKTTFKHALAFGLASGALLLIGSLIFFGVIAALALLKATILATVIMNLGSVLIGVAVAAVDVAYYVDYRIRREGLTHEVAHAECVALVS